MRRDAYFQELAKDNRRNMTAGETVLWSRLRAHRMDGHKFRRQHAIGRYVVDFVCLQARLVIEVDGGTHAEDSREAQDKQRTAFLEKQGFRVLRFWNDAVYTNLDGVTETIFEELQAQAAARKAALRTGHTDRSPTLSPDGERGPAQN